MKTNFFYGCKTSGAVRDRYDQLAVVFNPTNSKEPNEMMNMIRDEYDMLMIVFKDAKLAEAIKEKATVAEKVQEVRKEKASLSEKIKELQEEVNTEGLHLEVIKDWVWVWGRTFEIKDTLKSLGFKYSPHKQSWYFRDEESRSFNQTPIPMDQIRELYGSKEVALR
jgi:gas vesicle protein